MSFKSFDFFVQRTTAASTTSERDIIGSIRFTRKSGKLGRNVRVITCHTTGILATYKDGKNSANSACGMFRIANRTQKVLDHLNGQSPVESLANNVGPNQPTVPITLSDDIAASSWSSFPSVPYIGSFGPEGIKGHEGRENGSRDCKMSAPPMAAGPSRAGGWLTHLLVLASLRLFVLQA